MFTRPKELTKRRILALAIFALLFTSACSSGQRLPSKKLLRDEALSVRSYPRIKFRTTSKREAVLVGTDKGLFRVLPTATGTSTPIRLMRGFYSSNIAILAPSPSGHGLAYIRSRSIWVGAGDFKEPVRVADISANWVVENLVWAPNKKALAVLTSRTELLDKSKPRISNPAIRFYKVFTLDLRKGKVELLRTFSFRDGSSDVEPPRSKDDFKQMRWTDRGLIVVVGKKVFDFGAPKKLTLKPQFTLKHQPASDAGTAISPDGRRIIYTAIYSAHGLFMADLRSGRERLVVKASPESGFEEDVSVTWKSNDDALVMVNNWKNDRIDVSTVNRKGTLKRTGEIPGLGYFYTYGQMSQGLVSPAKQRIAIESQGQADRLISIIDFDTLETSATNITGIRRIYGWITVD